MNMERAKDLRGSTTWGDIVEELDKKIFNISLKLHTCKPEDLGLLQAEIRILQSLKNLPDDIIQREEDVDGRT